MRTVAGPTYYCRTGKSFKGHVKEKFLLVDCAVVMSGSYRCALPHIPNTTHPRATTLEALALRPPTQPCRASGR